MKEKLKITFKIFTFIIGLIAVLIAFEVSTILLTEADTLLNILGFLLMAMTISFAIINIFHIYKNK